MLSIRRTDSHFPASVLVANVFSIAHQIRPMLASKLPRIAFGGDYNPEQWSPEIWEEDMRLMRDAGVNLVSVGIFSWAHLNPAPGEFTFEWLDRLMDLLHENGILADLATGTASPPRWLNHQFPDSIPYDRTGRPFHPGSRQCYTPNSPSFLKYSRELVTALADRYKEHPALALWHISNELACHVGHSFGEADATAFRSWLQQRYESLDALNEAWGTAFWSQKVGDWEEVLPPLQTPTLGNPAQELDYRRFMNAAFLAQYEGERAILREATPDIPVTTNFMGAFKNIDQWSFVDSLDIASWDSYPDPAEARTSLGDPFGHDLTRSLKRQPYLLMEQAPSAVNWRAINRPKPPGLMRLWSYQALARGADGILYFQWRQSRAGAEKFHSAMVPHGDTRVSRAYREISELGEELGKLEALVGSTVEARIAIVLDWESWWAIEEPAKPRQFDYAELVREFHSMFVRDNLPVDFVHPEGDLSPYSLVVVPSLYIVTDATAENLTRFVERGGKLIATFFTGVVDEHEQIDPRGAPGKLRELFGLWVEEWDGCPRGETGTIAFDDGMTVSTSYLHEVLQIDGARAWARYGTGFYASQPAMTMNQVGEGLVYYLGTRIETEYLANFINLVAHDCGIRPILRQQEGIEVSIRMKGDQRFLFILNHRDERTIVDINPYCGTDLLSELFCRDQIFLRPYDATVIELDDDES